MAYYFQCQDIGSFFCPGIPYFSNPELTYNGDPLGIPADYPSTGVDGPADAVGALNERREITANFRRSLTSPTPRVGLALSLYWLAENGGTTTVRAMLHRSSSEDTTVTVSAAPSEFVTLSGDGTLTIPAGETVSTNEVTINGVDNGSQTGEVIVTVSATAANPSNLGVIAPEPVALSIVDDETTPAVALSLSPQEVLEGEDWRGRRTFVTAMLDSRSSAETRVEVSASPPDAVEPIWWSHLTIPAGQLASEVGEITAVDDNEFTTPEKIVTVSGTATNLQGVTGPESVTFTIIDDDGPYFAGDTITYTFTAGIAASRFLPQATYQNRTLTYSLSPAPTNGVIFTPGTPARIGVSPEAVAASETSYTLIATDAEGHTDTMTVTITVRDGVCDNSTAVSGYLGPEIVTDCETLLSFKDALRTDQSLNWSEDLSLGNWHGVEIANNRVVRVNASSLGLSGFIPSELGSLTELQVLNISDNQLIGQIPPELGDLSNLLSLDLSYNDLLDPIPPELNGLVELETLNLHGNDLTGEISDWLTNFSNLQSLSLGFNEMTGSIPPELGSLMSLQFLDLNGNKLTGAIPSELADLTNLRGLHLGLNELTGHIPLPLGNLSNLEEMSLNDNQLTGPIPSEFGGLANLHFLRIRNNLLTGTIPPELASLPKLQALYLSGTNQLTGCIPSGLSDLSANDFGQLGLPFCVDEVESSTCVTGGAVTDATNTGLSSDCEALLAARDTLAGTATLNWSEDTPTAQWDGVTLRGTPPRVAWLDLRDRGLGGSIPAALGRLSNLTYLNLRGNNLSGSIPTDLGLLTRLGVLNLHSNELSGPIPDLSGMTRLDQLYLANNGLTGDLPAWLGTMTNLRELWVWGNELSGPIPDLSEMTALVRLKLQTNKLEGPVPPWFGDMTDLVYLYLHDNLLTGEIPSELGDMSSLRYLWLHTNELEGGLPPELSQLSNLWDLNLHSNDLTGQIPAELGTMTNLTHLRLHRNILSGEIPATLGNLESLRFMWLHGNTLSGSIPREFRGLTMLERLLLSENELSGQIPADLGELSDHSLVQWRLGGGNNQFSGCVPAGLAAVDDNDIHLLGLDVCLDS